MIKIFGEQHVKQHIKKEHFDTIKRVFNSIPKDDIENQVYRITYFDSRIYNMFSVENDEYILCAEYKIVKKKNYFNDSR